MLFRSLLLGAAEISELLGPDACRAAVERAFALYAEGKMSPPGVLGVPCEGGGFHLKTGLLDGATPYFAVKVNANFPENGRRFGMPTIQGLIVLADARHGQPLAVMDSAAITCLRTAAATAVAAKYLASPQAHVLTICGCGVQAAPQVRALARVLPLERVYAFDLSAARAERLAEDLRCELKLEALVAGDLAEAVQRSQVCVTCTPSKRPFLRPEHVAPGTFIAAVGADSPEKQELEPELLAGAKLVVDVLEQCAIMGELHHALEAGVMTREDVHAELGAVVAGRKPGRTSAEEITIFDSTGMGLQDVAAAAVVYEKAVAGGVGMRFTPAASGSGRVNG